MALQCPVFSASSRHPRSKSQSGRSWGKPVVNIGPSFTVGLEGLEIRRHADHTLEDSIYRVHAQETDLLPAAGVGAGHALEHPRHRRRESSDLYLPATCAALSACCEASSASFFPNANMAALCPLSPRRGWVSESLNSVLLQCLAKCSFL